MVTYTCKRCGNFSSHIKTHYIRHLNRKKSCKPLNSSISICTLKVQIENSIFEVTPIDSKMTPIDSYLAKNDSKMTPVCKKMTPIDSKMTPVCKKMTPIDSFSYIDSKMTPIYKSINVKNIENIENIENIIFKKKKKVYECELCKRQYSKNSNLHRHFNKCKIKNNLYIENQIIKAKQQSKDELILELKKEKEYMRIEIAKLLDKVGNITNITNNQQNVFINSHGNENLDYISQNFLNNLLKIPYSAVPTLIKNIHFHPEHPENRNIQITNKKLKWAKVWEGNKWIILDKRSVIENMVDKGFNIIDGQYRNEDSILEPPKKKKYTDFQKKFENLDKNIHKILQKDIEVLVINNS